MNLFMVEPGSESPGARPLFFFPFFYCIEPGSESPGARRISSPFQIDFQENYRKREKKRKKKKNKKMKVNKKPDESVGVGQVPLLDPSLLLVIGPSPDAGGPRAPHCHWASEWVLWTE